MGVSLESYRTSQLHQLSRSLALYGQRQCNNQNWRRLSALAIPSLAAINAKKLKFTTMRGAFSQKELSGFVGRLLSAREATAPLAKLPEIKKVKEWDGKDEEA